MIKKYVLTGAPCSGKTTMLELLAGEGFSILPEAARFIIEDQQSTGGNFLPWKDKDGFQQAVAKKQLELEQGLPKNCEVFLDRGVVDGLAYYRWYGLEAPQFLIENARNNRYDKIFFLEGLPNYEKDLSRREDAETAKLIDQYLREIYSNLGYDLVEVPLMAISERKHFILDTLQNS